MELQLHMPLLLLIKGRVTGSASRGFMPEFFAMRSILQLVLQKRFLLPLLHRQQPVPWQISP